MKTTNKIKLVYSYNGKFHHHLPDNKIRYTGGVTRIVSVDPTTLNYSNLYALISKRVNSNNFTLKYKLPGTESDDTPLIVLHSDEDVFCMIEEFEDYYERRFNECDFMSFRIWLYVCNSVADGVQTRVMSDGYRDFYRLRQLMSNKKGSGNEKDCLRKLVLKQQLMLAIQRDQIQGYLGRVNLENNYKVNYDFDRPLIDLGDETLGFNSANQVDCDQDCNSVEICAQEDVTDAKIDDTEKSGIVREISTQGTVMVAATSMNVSSYQPSQSSSEMETPECSSVSVIDTEAKEPNALMSVDEIRTASDDDEKVLENSNRSDGFPGDLSVVYNQLANRELQIIKESDLEFVKELGSGNYGSVYHGKWKGADVAVKKIRPRLFNGDVMEDDRLVSDFWKEARILSQSHHPNIVAFYSVVNDGPITNLRTVTEYMPDGSLKQVLQRKDRSVDRRQRLILAMDAAFGMEYLHEKKIVHFDLKSHNFLVNMNDPRRPVCKIGDLGLSKIKQRTMVSGGVRGTIPWMAPELLNSLTNLVSEKVDVYSFGVLMWELLTGEEPYADMPSGEIIGKYNSSDQILDCFLALIFPDNAITMSQMELMNGRLRPEIPNWCEQGWKSLMERCWSSDPNSRPSFSEIAKELRSMSTSTND